MLRFSTLAPAPHHTVPPPDHTPIYPFADCVLTAESLLAKKVDGPSRLLASNFRRPPLRAAPPLVATQQL